MKVQAFQEIGLHLFLLRTWYERFLSTVHTVLRPWYALVWWGVAAPSRSISHRNRARSQVMTLDITTIPCHEQPPGRGEDLVKHLFWPRGVMGGFTWRWNPPVKSVGSQQDLDLYKQVVQKQRSMLEEQLRQRLATTSSFQAVAQWTQSGWGHVVGTEWVGRLTTRMLVLIRCLCYLVVNL